MVATDTNPYDDALEHFEKVLKLSNLLFHAEPEYKKKLLGLSTEFVGIKTIVDNWNVNTNNISTQPSQVSSVKQHEIGYCIRTGEEIPFNLDKPMNYKSYQTWAQFKDYDYPEHFCHKTGKPSNGQTSMRKPVLYWKKV
jgi:hypothetical protein